MLASGAAMQLSHLAVVHVGNAASNGAVDVGQIETNRAGNASGTVPPDMLLHSIGME